AGVHAGVIQAGRPGIATILITAGADTFPASDRNGVKTQAYGPYGMAYVFDRSGSPGQIDWSTTAVGIPETFTTSIPLVCPGGGSMTHPIWGTDVYIEDSSICTAALHAGIVTRSD